MTSERANAYGRVVKALSDLGPSKLHDREEDLLREAADTLFFADGDSDREMAWKALDDAGELAAQLADSDRLVPETAERLLADLAACGPDSVIGAAA